MPKRTKHERRMLEEVESKDLMMEETNPGVPAPKPYTPQQFPLFSVRNIIIVVVLLILALAWKMKGMLIAATVNGAPISRFELNDALTQRYGNPTLDGIINEKLIIGAVRQKGITVSQDEINKKVKEIEGRLNGSISLKDALAAQGMTEDSFRHQVEVQLSIDKLFDKDASVSSEEVNQYIASNSASFENATDPAQLKKDVTDILRQQKINDLFQTWFENIKKDAKIQKFI